MPVLYNKRPAVRYDPTESQLLEISVFLLPSTDYGKLVLERLSSHQIRLLQNQDPAGSALNGRWTFEFQRPDNAMDFQEVTVQRDALGLRFVVPDLELVPALPELGVDFAAITLTVAEADSSVLKTSAGGWRTSPNAAGAPAHAWRVMPGMVGSTPVRTVEVRARARYGNLSPQAAATVFAEVMCGHSPTISSANTRFRLDPWSEFDLTARRP